MNTVNVDGATRLGLRRAPSSDRFLGVFSQSQSETDASSAGDELSEDDVFWTGDFTESTNHSTPPNPQPHHHHPPKSFALAEKSGILAALPETDRIDDRSVFKHKVELRISASSPRVSSSSSSSSASSSRMTIPMAPKKQNTPNRHNSAMVHQSAPVNVPMLSEAMRRWREVREFDDIDSIVEEGDGEMLPPHELVAAKESPMLANSVLEGVGRTLKGRDLRQVRNAVWRKTGFVD